MLRVSELAALNTYDVSTELDGSGRLTISSSKTDQAGAGAALYLGASTLPRAFTPGYRARPGLLPLHPVPKDKWTFCRRHCSPEGKPGTGYGSGLELVSVVGVRQTGFLRGLRLKSVLVA